MPANWVHPIPTVEAFRIDRILFDIQHDRAEEARFFADPQAYIAGVELSGRARAAISTTDIGALYRLGANPYLLRAYCLQLKVPEADYLAALRAVGEPDHG
jgi:protocatechuate 4,5-dioxygenase alpha chain